MDTGAPAKMSAAARALLAAILVLAACARLIAITAIPPGFYSDEANTGYIAYSLLLTGRDAHGAWMPIYTQALDFWWANLVGFLLIPPVMLLGLNQFAVRFPFAVWGILTVLLVFLIVRKRFYTSAALWAAFLLAVAPWHVHQSRYCNDTILMTFLFTLALYFFAAGLQGRSFYFSLSAIAFALTTYTYISSRIFIPLAGLGLIVIYRKELVARRKAVAAACALFVLMLLPTVMFAFRDPAHFFLRYRQVGVTAGGRSFGTGILLFIRNYLAHLSPVFLFFRGDANIRNFPRGFGQLYLFELPLVIAGIIAAIRKRGNPDARFLLFWLFIYAIPASLTVENIPHGLRASTAIPLYDILAAVGIWSLAQRIRALGTRARCLARTATAAFCLLAALNGYLFWRHYILRYPVYSARAWDYGWGEALGYAKSVESQYDRIVLTVLSVGPPTMYPPFYLAYDPARYQRAKLEGSKYRFVTPEIMRGFAATAKGRTLYLIREEELGGIPPAKVIYFPDGTIAFKILDIMN